MLSVRISHKTRLLRGCLVVSTGLGSKNASQTVSSQKTSIFKMVNNVKHKAEKVVNKVGRTAESKFTHVPEVRTRYFYNSNYQYKKVSGLLARGNKKEF